MGAPSQTTAEFYKVDVKLCYPFIEAVTHTLKVQCKVDARVGKPGFKRVTEEGRYDILIGATISSEKMLGQVVLCLTNKIFFVFMSKMLGRIVSKMTPEIEDGAQELMNIIFNQAKKLLAEKQLASIRSIPTIAFGEHVKLRYLTRGQTVLLPFETEHGAFNVEITTQDITTSDTITPTGLKD